jgi:hypothetical protein
MAPQRGLDDVHQLICSSNGEKLPNNLLVLTMAIGRVLREVAGPSDLCCGVLFLVVLKICLPDCTPQLARG